MSTRSKRCNCGGFFTRDYTAKSAGHHSDAGYDANYDRDPRWAWVCTNCGRVDEIKHRREKFDSGIDGCDIPMTHKQSLAIRRIRQEALADRENYEIKTFEVNELSYGNLAVAISAGYVGDETDARSLCCRNRGHFVVGTRGGIKSLYLPPKSRKQKYALIYGWTR